MIREDIQLGLSDPWWRICNLYWIVDKDGRPVPFKPNAEQADFYQELHTRNAVLKARQKGFSTLMQIIGLDQCLFNDNFTSNTIADTLPNAGKLFRKAAFAYDRLPEVIKASRPVKSRTNSEIMFENGSSFSVGTSARGGTVQFLHISEMGKIAKKYPEKAREIVTGAFEAVPLSGTIVVESTAEGNGGEFFDICDAALKKREAQSPMTELDFKLHFYPWFASQEYRINPTGVVFTEADSKYFREVEAKAGTKLDEQQRAWYVKKRDVLKRDMKREYPPAATGASVEIVYAAYPTDIVEPADGALYTAVAGNISLPDIYGNVIQDYILYRAYTKDSEYAGNAQRAQAHYAAFANALGIEIKATVAVAPNPIHNPNQPRMQQQSGN